MGNCYAMNKMFFFAYHNLKTVFKFMVLFVGDGDLYKGENSVRTSISFLQIGL